VEARPLSSRIRAVLAALMASACLAPAAGAQPERCPPTRADALGPFYTPNAPERATTGRGLGVAGRVLSAAGCAPLAGAKIEWWSANPRGDYDDEHRATQVADAQGRYRYETDFPGLYPGRPPHVHVRVSAPGHRVLVTQLYPKPGQRALDADFVLIRE
jgi:protocatechuate 3,4-dioxygenase beta subunit